MFKSWGTVTFRDGNHLFEGGIKSFKIKPPLSFNHSKSIGPFEPPKGPGAKKATRKSPGYFNQILNFES